MLLPTLVGSLLLLTCAHALQHAAMWGLNPGTPGTTADTPGKSMTDLTFDISNITLINENFHTYQVTALYPLQWTVSQSKKCFAPVKHTQTTPDGYFACIQMDPNYVNSWKTQFQLMEPAIHSGALKGIFLGDEHVYFGVTMREVKLMADLIRSDWPDAVIYMNEAPDVAMCNYNKQNLTVFQDDGEIVDQIFFALLLSSSSSSSHLRGSGFFHSCILWILISLHYTYIRSECLPQNVDWFGYDFYAHDSSSWTSSREAFETMVYPRLSRIDQRVVPTSLGYSDGSLTAKEADALDAFCSKNARHFLQWGLEDSRPVGLFPFHWNGGKRAANGSIVGGAGIIDLPRCAATYRAISEIILNAGPGGTTMDPTHRPPKPNSKGLFVEPQCTTPTQPPPSIWPWCSRT